MTSPPLGFAGRLVNQVIVGGAQSGVFVYNGTPGPGNPPIFSITGPATTTDPYGNAVVADGVTTYNTFGAVINVLSMAKGGFFQYFDNASAVQGALILSVASVGGTDPVTGATYFAGLVGTNPVFGDQLRAIGSQIDLVAVPFTSSGRIRVSTGSGAVNPSIVLFAPEQGVSGHLVMLMQGTSPDGTQPGQLCIASEPTGAAVPTPVSQALVEIQGSTNIRGTGAAILRINELGGAPAAPPSQIVSTTAGDRAFGIEVSGDANFRFRLDSNGRMDWGPGSAATDVTLARSAANTLAVTGGDLDIATAGNGLQIKEGSNARMGVSVLVAGNVVVSNTSITANTRVFLTMENSNGGAPGFLQVSTRTAGTSFTIHSSNAGDVSTVAWLLVEPG